MWDENYFYFFKPRGAYFDKKEVLHIVFSSVEGNYPREFYYEGDCIPISFPAYSESTLSLAEEALVLPRAVLDQDGKLPPIKFEWEFYGENGDGVEEAR